MHQSRFPTRLVASLVFALGTFGAAEAASTVSLIALTPAVTAGDAVTFELQMDFTGDATIGGDIDIVYGNFTDGNQLSFVSYTPFLGNPDNIGEPGDPTLTSAPLPDPNGWSGATMALSPTATATGLTGIAVGDLNGLDGQFLIGTLVFTANVAGGPYTLTAQDGASGGFFSTTGPAQLAQYNNLAASVAVEASPVPLPGAAWLMLSGLGGLVGFAKRRQALA